MNKVDPRPTAAEEKQQVEETTKSAWGARRTRADSTTSSSAATGTSASQDLASTIAESLARAQALVSVDPRRRTSHGGGVKPGDQNGTAQVDGPTPNGGGGAVGITIRGVSSSTPSSSATVASSAASSEQAKPQTSAGDNTSSSNGAVKQDKAEGTEVSSI